MSTATRRLLLGPQRPTLHLGEALGGFGLPEGPLAVISAGWQEAEGDINDVGEVVGRPLEDLKLYARAESVFGDDPELADAHRERQRTLRELQQLYRLRLKRRLWVLFRNLQFHCFSLPNVSDDFKYGHAFGSLVDVGGFRA